MSRLALVIIVALGSLYACDDSINKGPKSSEVSLYGTVSYDGTLGVKKLGFAVFKAQDYPPTASPPAATLVMEAGESGSFEFPVTYEITGLPSGEYYMEVYGDIDVTDTSHGPNLAKDPAASQIGPLTVVQGTPLKTDVALVDPSAPGDTVEEVESPADITEDDTELSDTHSEVLTPGDVTVTPKQGFGAIYGTVAWDGNADGKLIVLGFSTSPPSGPPTLMKSFPKPLFPQFYLIDNVTPGTHYLLAYLDKNSSDGMTNNPELDPASVGFRGVTVGAGDTQLEDFWLTVPQQ